MSQGEREPTRYSKADPAVARFSSLFSLSFATFSRDGAHFQRSGAYLPHYIWFCAWWCIFPYLPCLCIHSFQVTRAISALIKHHKDTAESSENKLFEDETEILIQVILRKIPNTDKASNTPHRMYAYIICCISPLISLCSPIPHTIYGREGQEIVLFTKDPAEEYKKQLAKNPVQGVNTVCS